MPSWFRSRTSPRTIWYVSPKYESGADPRLVVWKLAEDYYQVHYADGTEFLIDKSGSRVWATWPAKTLTAEDTATYLLGPILGFVLLLRGCSCLHASAVAIKDRAIALLGPAGVGKSTTAAAFAELGYSILAEDVVTLDDRETSFLVQPAYPCIRLWPASVRVLYGEHSELPQLTPTWDKRYLDLNKQKYKFQNEPLPLAAIYLLGERREDSLAPSIEKTTPGEALISLIANTYATYLMDNDMRAREFELLGRVVGNVSFRKVTPHTDPANIYKLCEAIVEDARQLPCQDLSSLDETQGVHV
ncbi:hypothetical protein BH18ACI4_BH18ACI4_06730 [soil metagenome]